MSHDRGCFKCHADPHEYRDCKRPTCPNRSVTEAFEAATTALTAKRPTCLSCGREQPLWGNCFRQAIDCPVRAPTAPNRPDTQIISVNQPGYEIVMFFNTDGGAQAVISRPGGREPIDFLIAPPLPNRRIVVTRKGDAFNVVYRDAP